MRNAVKVGDEVITIGGICGKIVKTKDETLTIQVGADKTKFEVMRWAISKVVTDESAPSPSKKTKREEPEEEQKEAPKKTLPKRMKRSEEATDAETPAEKPAETAEVEAETVETIAETVEDADNKE